MNILMYIYIQLHIYIYIYIYTYIYTTLRLKVLLIKLVFRTSSFNLSNFCVTNSDNVVFIENKNC